MEEKKSSFIGTYKLLYLYPLILILVAFIFQKPVEILLGMKTIFTSSSNLVTDYMEIGGIGAAFFNSGLMTLMSIFLMHKNKVNLTGPAIAAIFTVSGFSFFGKNLYNTIPITFGVYLFSKLEGSKFNTVILPALFGTALGPLVSEITFGFDLPIVKGVIYAYLVGILIGFILPALSQAFLRFHQGFNLYNVGFTAGIIGMFAIGIVRMFNQEINTVDIVSSGNNLPLAIILYTLFISIFLLGFIFNGKSFKGYNKLLMNSGRLIADFIHLYGNTVTLINMGLMGIIGTTYVLLVGGQINGPIVGGILTIVGFSAFGKHPKNTIPIFIGVYSASVLNIYDPKATNSLLAALFGTTLAPIAGHYGFFPGIFAGFCHMAVVANIGYLHGGVNLYNNGFSGGFVAATLVPLLNAIGEIINRFRRLDTWRVE